MKCHKIRIHVYFIKQTHSCKSNCNVAIEFVLSLSIYVNEGQFATKSYQLDLQFINGFSTICDHTRKISTK